MIAAREKEKQIKLKEYKFRRKNSQQVNLEKYKTDEDTSKWGDVD